MTEKTTNRYLPAIVLRFVPRFFFRGIFFHVEEVNDSFSSGDSKS
jgi:hypothetical protein